MKKGYGLPNMKKRYLHLQINQKIRFVYPEELKVNNEQHHY